jgi:hypothetical protein
MRKLWYMGKAYDDDNKLPAKSLLWGDHQLTLLSLHSFAALACKNVLALRIEHGEYIRTCKNPNAVQRVALRLQGKTNIHGPYQRRMGLYRRYHPRLCEFKDNAEQTSSLARRSGSYLMNKDNMEIFLRLFGEWIDPTM